MFAPFTRDLLRPEMSNTLDALLRQSPQRESMDDLIPTYGAFARRDRYAFGCPEMFQLFMNVKQFTKREVKVKIVDGFIEVNAKHNEQADVHGFVSREFTRRFKVPDCIDPSTIKCVFNKNNVLVIKAPMRNPKLEPTGEKILTVEDQKPYEMDNALPYENFLGGQKPSIPVA